MKQWAICYFYVFENTSKLSSRNAIHKRYKQEPRDACYLILLTHYAVVAE